MVSCLHKEFGGNFAPFFYTQVSRGWTVEALSTDPLESADPVPIMTA